MNRRIVALLAIAAMLALFIAHADARGITAGAKVGMNISSLRGEDVEGVDSKTGGALGGFVNIRVNDVLSVQPEFLVFSQKGAKLDPDFIGDQIDFKFLHDYFEIPILFKADIPVEGNVLPSVFAGPSLAIKLRAKARAEATGSAAEVDLDELGICLKSTDFGLVFGGGVGFPLGNGTMTVDGRYTVGMTDVWEVDVYEGEEYLGTVTPELKNGAFSILAGYEFSFE